MSDKAPRKARTRRLACPGCGGSIEIRANGISISAICASCGRTIDVASDELRIIAEAQQGTRTPTIPIGTRGTLSGTEWEVVGYQARSNPAEGWTWDEFLLFNPYRGFRFLAHDDEGWTLFRMLREDVPNPPGKPDSSQARTDYVLGEFYWRVRAGDTADIEQYDSLLVKETTGDEIVWSRGVKLPTDTVRAAFGLAPPPQAATSVDQRRRTIRVLWTGIAACVLVVLLNNIGFGASRPVLVFQQDYRVAASNRNRALVSDLFTVPDKNGNLRLDLATPVQNNWVSLSLSLVGDGGTPVFDASSTIEYYTGTDSDGAWEEGAQREQIMFRSIPGGVYRLLVEADAGALATPSAANEPQISFTIAATRHAPAPEFFWLALLLIVPYPIYRLIFKRKAK